MNPELARRAKEYAARNRQTFTEVVEQAVARLLAAPRNKARRKKIVLPVAGDPTHEVSEAELRRALGQADLEDDLKRIRGGGA